MNLTDFRAIYLPYCLKRQEDGNYAVLNRNYKPIGFVTKRFIKYSDYPVLSNFKITKAEAKKLSYKADDDTDIIYLYNDACNPLNSSKDMAAYWGRMAILAPLTLDFA